VVAVTTRCVKEPYGSGHTYAIDGRRVPGVTTILGAAIDKPGLRYWYAHQAVLWAMTQDPEYLKGLDGKELKYQAGQAPNVMRDAAAVEGKTLHAYAEALGAGEEIEPTSELAARAELVADFLDRFQVKVLASELTVWHDKLKYAGTLDVIADLLIDGQWQRWLLDYKSGQGIYTEAVLQCAAYRYATHCVWQGDDRPMAQVQRVGIVHVTSAGWALKPIKADQKAFTAFTQARKLHSFLAIKPEELIEPALPHPTLEGEHAS
jgi:hypothetical protein